MSANPLWPELRRSLIAVGALALLCCALYPALVWAAARVFFPNRARGSLLERGGRVVGSSLLGQGFSGARYFHPRPSAAGDGYDAASSGGSNLGPLSKSLLDSVAERARAYRAENSLPAEAPLPADAVTASGSGLDPHISVENALLQAPRVAAAREIPVDEVRAEVKAHAEGRTMGFLGEPRVNVLLLNLALDERK